MDESAIERARERISTAAEARPGTAELAAALEQAQARVEALAQATDELRGTLPENIGATIRDGLRQEALPVARQLAEVRGLMNQVIRRLERLEGEATSDRTTRVDDLAVLVDLIVSGWKSTERRLARIEDRLASSGAAVYRIEERRSTADAS